MKVGVLVPQSKLYPRLGKDFVNGFRFGDATFPNRTIEIVIQTLASGQFRDGFKDVCHAMQLQHQVDAIVGFAETPALDDMATFTEENRLPLIVTNIGGKLPVGIEPSPFLFFNGLDQWQSMWLLGKYVGQQVGDQYLVASEYYEGGYDFTMAFQEGLKLVGEATPLANYIKTFNPLPGDEMTLVNFVKELQPKVIQAAYSGQHALEFFERCAQHQLNENATVAASFYSVAEDLLPQLNVAAVGTLTSTSWYSGLSLAANQQFVTQYDDEFEDLPSAFSLLGYEAALLLHQAYRDAGLEKFKPKAFSSALATVAINSPRGTLKMDATTQRTITDHYLLEVVSNEGILQLKEVQQLEEGEGLEARLTQLADTQKHGWTNPYLCV